MEGSLLEFAVELGYQIQVAGGEIYRVEESIGRVLTAYGVEGGSVFAIPNCIIASAPGSDGQPQTRVRRVPAHGTDIYRLEAVNELCRELCQRPAPLEEAWKRLEECDQKEVFYPRHVTLLAYFLGAAMFALFFQGSWRDSLCAGLCGASIGLCQWGMERLRANLFFKTLAAGAVSGLLALILVWMGLGTNDDLITIGALMILVPGVALTNAVRDVMVGDMMSGISKLGEAVLIAVAIALGTGLALALGGLGGIS